MFREDADFIVAISDNIKLQIREQIAGDNAIVYFLEDDNRPGFNFEKIQPNHQKAI